MEYNKLDWLRLFFTPSIGAITFRHLIAKFKTPTIAIENLPFIKNINTYKNRNNIIVPSVSWMQNYIDQCNKQNVFLVAAFEKEYPKNLLNISDYPPVLHVKCKKEFFNKHLLNGNNFAIVGARNASLQGCSFASKIASELTANGMVIVSGLARGIDAAAHKAALKASSDNLVTHNVPNNMTNIKTIAVLGCGLNVIYPQENKELYDQIANAGAIISETTLNQQPRPQTFTYRNRIISGMSSGVLVVEAAKKSGSLITARYAAEQGRDVFAVPGHPYDARASGANYLIRNGAILTENHHQIIEAMNKENIYQKIYQQVDLIHSGTEQAPEHNAFGKYQVNQKAEHNMESAFFKNSKEESENEKHNSDYDNLIEKLRGQLGSSPLSIGEIANKLEVDIQHLQGAVAELELMGEIEVDGNLIRKLFL